MSASTSTDPKSMLGRWLPGGYRIERFIGAGAFAWVFYATTPRHEPVAIKVLQADSEEARTLFAREIKVLRQLPASPYCVAYVDDGTTEDGMAFLVMEFIDGATLKDAFKFKPVWPIDEACYLMVQLCDALAGLHRLGVAHRDLKPENVMVTRDWQVKLMDFGLVKDAQGLLKLFETEDILTGRDFAENVDKAMLAGTPEYMAPEQFSDPMIEDESLAKTDTWSDVYSLGLIFYQLLVGQKLFPFRPGTTDSAAYARALLAYIRQRTAFQESQLHRPEQIPEPLWRVIQVALRQNPKQRQHNAVELGDGVRRYLETGESEEFRDDEHTSMADMSQLLAGLSGAYGGAAAETTTVSPLSGEYSDHGLRPRSVRPPAPDGFEATMTAKSTPPPIDVAAVQAYREQRLNDMRAPDVSYMPGELPRVRDPSMEIAVPLVARASMQAPPKGARPVARTRAPQRRGWMMLALVGIAVLGASAATVYFLLLMRRA